MDRWGEKKKKRETQGSSSNNKERQSSKETNLLTKTPVAFGARFQFRDIVSSHNVMQRCSGRWGGGLQRETERQGESGCESVFSPAALC